MIKATIILLIVSITASVVHHIIARSIPTWEWFAYAMNDMTPTKYVVSKIITILVWVATLTCAIITVAKY